MSKKKRPSPPPAMPPPARPMLSPEQRRTLFWASLLWAGLFAVYMFSHDHIYYFDALIHGGTVENTLMDRPPEIIYEWNHFLWYPTGRLFYLAIHAAGASLRGYETLQLLNSIIGATGIVILFLILRRLTSLGWALCWSLPAAFSEVYWYRSAGAENHLSGTFWLIVFCWFLVSYWKTPTFWRLIALCTMSILALYYHFGNFAIFPALFAIVFIKHKPGEAVMRSLWIALFLFVAMLPYANVHRWFEPGGFHQWWLWSTTLAHGQSPLAHKTGDISLAVRSNLLLTLETLLKSIFYFVQIDGALVARVAVFSGLIAFAVFYGRSKTAPAAELLPSDRVGWIFVIPFLCFLVLYTLWIPGNYKYWAMHFAFLCLLLGTLSYHRQPSRVLFLQMLCFGLATAVLAQNNYTALIGPQREGRQVRYYIEACDQIARVTPPESPIVISGHGWGDMKPYIPYFAHRPRLAIDLFIINNFGPGKKPLEELSRTIISYMVHGIPVYMTQDTLESAATFSDFQIPPASVEAIWKPFTLLPVARFSGGPTPNGLYLLWTNRLPPGAQNLILLQLKVAGLQDQVRLVEKERSHAGR